MLDAIQRFIQELLGADALLQGNILASLLGLVAVLALRFAAMRAVQHKIEDPVALYRWRKSISYAGFVLGLLAIGWPWIPSLHGVPTFLGIATAGLAVALQDPIVNLAGWAFILWRRPFMVGDRVEIGAHRGDVIDVRIFQFSLLEIGNWVHADQSTGRVIHVPNGKVFRETLANYTRGFEFIWDEIPVLVTFESDWQKAKELLLAIVGRHAAHMSKTAQDQLRRAAQRYMIFYTKLTPTVYTSVEDSGVLLTMRYLCEPRKRRGTAEAIWEDVLRELAQHADIDFAYPTRRFYDNRVEGKPGARAD